MNQAIWIISNKQLNKHTIKYNNKLFTPGYTCSFAQQLVVDLFGEMYQNVSIQQRDSPDSLFTNQAATDKSFSKYFNATNVKCPLFLDSDIDLTLFARSNSFFQISESLFYFKNPSDIFKSTDSQVVKLLTQSSVKFIGQIPVGLILQQLKSQSNNKQLIQILTIYNQIQQTFALDCNVIFKESRLFINILNKQHVFMPAESNKLIQLLQQLQLHSIKAEYESMISNIQNIDIVQIQLILNKLIESYYYESNNCQEFIQLQSNYKIEDDLKQTILVGQDIVQDLAVAVTLYYKDKLEIKSSGDIQRHFFKIGRFFVVDLERDDTQSKIQRFIENKIKLRQQYLIKEVKTEEIETNELNFGFQEINQQTLDSKTAQFETEQIQTQQFKTEPEIKKKKEFILSKKPEKQIFKLGNVEIQVQSLCKTVIEKVAEIVAEPVEVDLTVEEL
ncbi:Hypothetical_protein [Hexamita inflata]|uniref:Hypothetical_protein n=1 Tax=Hexamita inflata TaxID=28002 RepID=A0AA86NUU1_9EUKA|nr:Hypothetical protein HINF_LOCUS13656 [Hexamita inflata]CAI9962604.1 Hypothetical protein HINF_LOCUS50249 [Hexamita inflata]